MAADSNNDKEGWRVDLINNKSFCFAYRNQIEWLVWFYFYLNLNYIEQNRTKLHPKKSRLSLQNLHLKKKNYAVAPT